jgi:transposase
MSAKRLSMRKIREVLRLWIEHELPYRAIARSCAINHRTVARYIHRFVYSGLPWPLPEDLDEQSLYRQLFPKKETVLSDDAAQMPDMKYLHQELRRPGMTLYRLWEEYREREPHGYRRSQFYEHYRRWVKKLHPTLRQEHKAGEKVFVDYAGKKPHIVNPQTGEITEVELFVGCLGASSYTYAEATYTQGLPDWIGAHVRMLEFFGAVPAIVVPDNLKSGITRACRYEPDINPTYLEFADHYGLAVISARQGRARDKAKVESAVQIAERWILAGLRDQTFFSLGELNAAIRDVLARLNTRKFQKLDVSRRELFQEIDRPAMKPLPPTRYEYGEWRKAKVNIDYHIEVASNYYSVPYSLIHQKVEIRLTSSVVEIWYQGRRIASHPRRYGKGGHQTQESHRPPSHTRYLQWTPERILTWARKTGPWTEALMEKVMATRRHPEQGYRSCLGILRLAQKYSPHRLERACRRALQLQGYSYSSIRSILERGLDGQPLPEDTPPQESLPVLHTNIRGKHYYH